METQDTLSCVCVCVCVFLGAMRVGVSGCVHGYMV